MKYDKLFIGGDLSGIQNFLYNISSKKAAVSLKGRSFFLQQYMENICEDLKNITKESGSVECKDIYCSGGKFYVLADYSLEIVKAIDQYISKVKGELWLVHRGQLGINISYVPFSENPDGTVDCNEQSHVKPGYLWKVVNADFYKQKNQKHKEQLVSDFNSFFTPIPVGNNTKVCAITGIESDDCVPAKLGENGDSYVLPSVIQQIQLGESLRNSENFKSFEDYAGDTNLGILRMDVDGLGKRFSEGFDSIRSYQEFSNRLVKFFGAELREMQQTYREYLNIIYSGGDDLFIVGRWDKVIDFAELIHKETISHFGKDGVSISGGIAVVKPTFPIAKAADLAGEAEENAKQYDGEKNGNKEYGKKNAFHMLGKTISWYEFDYVKGYKDKFVTLIDKHSLSKSILHQIMLYSSIVDKNAILKADEPKDYSYIWHLSYYLTRFAKRYEKSMEICKFCYNLRDNELKNERKLELIALAARWAELLLKDELNNN